MVLIGEGCEPSRVRSLFRDVILDVRVVCYREPDFARYTTGEELRFEHYHSGFSFETFHGLLFPYVCMVGFFDSRFTYFNHRPSVQVPRILKSVNACL